jgi:hypothetical protein
MNPVPSGKALKQLPRTSFLTTLAMIVVAGLGISVAGHSTAGKSGGIDGNCRGLHAGIRAELVRHDLPSTQPPFVMINFILLNDDETAVNSSADSWKIVIDGKELSDSGMIFGNGPGPVGGGEL